VHMATLDLALLCLATCTCTCVYNLQCVCDQLCTVSTLADMCLPKHMHCSQPVCPEHSPPDRPPLRESNSIQAFAVAADVGLLHAMLVGCPSKSTRQGAMAHLCPPPPRAKHHTHRDVMHMHVRY
jgi:hypothetical protein